MTKKYYIEVKYISKKYMSKYSLHHNFFKKTIFLQKSSVF